MIISYKIPSIETAVANVFTKFGDSYSKTIKRDSYPIKLGTFWLRFKYTILNFVEALQKAVKS